MDKDFTPDFFIIPYQLIADDRLTGIDHRVYATIYWYERLKDGRCFASNEALARVAKATPTSVSNSLTKLEEYGYIKRTFKDDNKKDERIEISCTIHFRVNDPFTPALMVIHPQMNRESNKRESNSRDTAQPEKDNPTGVKAYLDLYRALYYYKVGVPLVITNWPKIYAQLKPLSKSFTSAQIRAIIFCHFEWRGLNGDDDYILKKLASEGFPIGLMVYNSPNYAAYLHKTMGDEWENDKLLTDKVDTWEKELSNKKNN